MNRKRFFVLAVALVPVFSAGCETMQEALNLKKPSARLTGLKFEDVKLDAAILLFDVEVDNPYPIALPLMNLDYGLSSGAQPFLTGRTALQTIVPARSKKTVSLPASINYMDIFRALRGIRPGSRIPYKADLGLSVDTPALGLIRLPLKKEGELVLPTVSDTNIKDIWDIIKPK